ncbi:helix-turn-helix domain-containing protein [Agrobacterium rosae]|uniref:AraC family transcriptional regulator n=1 Tax=Agrobacterium rosae TaxID=1972867 RepID=A0AAE5RVZ9_9HYPH|nr:helix-turn-helix domain-containing protein [Agrobacterium rosae]KAA3515681.1 helix-turn-helix domain-containing protein [Agrobacterium rosae]KAA3524642.1 helix-turn-helix domain-containing protein [Agrobacterium rosae]MBN7804024.1 helix-turn-helix domain-containing protein [Agrobacterium rosae]MCM2431583.1 helix-turn-helix domain-containing protein [Agrobacterium rosae]MDX8328751.1 helix-turn-helix domain-containing protein [Agrobacterium rosae]
MSVLLPVQRDESVPVHPEHDPRHPLVVFGDHRFCGGEASLVQVMAGPHMHSQVELNFVLEGDMTYWFDGRELTIGAGRLCLFWGMIPHQVIARAEGTRFVCLYVPMSFFLGLASLTRFRDAVFRGAMIEALELRSYDNEIFQRWRDELRSGDEGLIEIVRNELGARVLRIERDGWRDLREEGSAIASLGANDSERTEHVERMLRYIAENALNNISADDVGRDAGLHPNYAMSVFKRAVGMTINQAIIRHRLDTAQSLLIATDMPITDVAFESGFGSVSRFYQAFSDRFSQRPKQYRASMRSKV